MPLDIATHDQLKRRAPAADDGEVLIYGLGTVGSTLNVGESAFEAELAAAGLLKFGQELGVFVADQDPEAREEGVAVPQVAHTASVPAFEGCVRSALRRGRVALEHDDLAAGWPEGQRRPEAGAHSGADHQHPVPRHGGTSPIGLRSPSP